MGRLDKDVYEGQKYHFRYYRPAHNHPFLVAIVKESIDSEGKASLSGFNMTHSAFMVLNNPNKFIKLDVNPNPEDETESYVCTTMVKNKPLKLFSSPIKNWKLSKTDEEKIDKLFNE